MAKPLRSDDPNPQSVQFSHFGVLNTGTRSRGAAFTSIGVNLSLLALILVLGAMVKKNPVLARKVAELTLPPKPIEPPKPTPKPPPPPPKPLPTPPKIKEVPPKVVTPPKPVPIPPTVKPVPVPTPKPVVVTPPAPKRVDPPPAPTVVHLAQPHAASIVNNDVHPSPVRLGNPEIRALNGPPVATAVNLGGGMHNMPASNTGSGPRATSVNLGSGSPQGTNLNGRDRGITPVKGLINGYGNNPNGRGAYRGPEAVQIAQAHPVQAVHMNEPTAISQAKPPVFTYKPRPAYTEDARAAHVEGVIRVRIRVTSAGTVEFISAANSLGHGLDESARNVVAGMRARPALNAAGQPTDWTGEVAIVFQIS